MKTPQEDRERFERRYRAWRERIESPEIALASADTPYIDNPEFGAMVDMGWDAVPYMIEKLRGEEEAHFLIHALAAITGDRPSARSGEKQGDGTPEAAGNQAVAQAWVAWWDARAARQDRDSHSDESGS